MSYFPTQSSTLFFPPDDLPNETMAIPCYSMIKSRFIDVFAHNVPKLIDQMAQDKLHPYVLDAVGSKITRFKLLLSYYSLEIFNYDIVDCLETLNKIPTSVKDTKFIGLRTYFLIGRSLSILRSAFPDSAPISEMISSYCELSRVIQLEVERRGYGKPFVALLSHLHYTPNSSSSSSSSSSSMTKKRIINQEIGNGPSAF